MQRIIFHSACLVLALCLFGCDTESIPKPRESDETVQEKREQKKPGHLSSPHDLEPEVLAEFRGQLKSDDRQERIVAMQQLHEVRDVESLGKIIESLEHPDPIVRKQAYESVGKLAGFYMPFDAAKPPHTQREAIEFYRQFWLEVKDPNSMFMEIMRNPELKHTKYADRSARDER